MASMPSVATGLRRVTSPASNGGVGSYSEARYHYAFNSGIPTAFVPVTFGFRLN